MKRKSGILYIANEAQRIIFEHEMVGQLSDGYWENSSPHNHWLPWVMAEVLIAEDGQVGRTFWADKCNYNFANSMLLEAVGHHMLVKVKAHLMGYSDSIIGQLPDGADDYQDHVRYAARDGNKGYWAGKLQALGKAGINYQAMQAIDAWDGYTMKDLRKDCRALGVAAKTRLS